MATKGTQCNCFAEGPCDCSNPVEPIKVDALVKPKIGVPPFSQPAFSQTPAANADDTIFGLPKGLVILGGMAAGLYFLSQMDGKK